MQNHAGGARTSVGSQLPWQMEWVNIRKYEKANGGIALVAAAVLVVLIAPPSSSSLSSPPTLLLSAI